MKGISSICNTGKGGEWEKKLNSQMKILHRNKSRSACSKPPSCHLDLLNVQSCRVGFLKQWALGKNSFTRAGGLAKHGMPSPREQTPVRYVPEEMWFIQISQEAFLPYTWAENYVFWSLPLAVEDQSISMGVYMVGVTKRSSQGLLINLNFRVYPEDQEAFSKTTQCLLLISKTELAAHWLTREGDLSAPLLQNSCGIKLSWSTEPLNNLIWWCSQ